MESNQLRTIKEQPLEKSPLFYGTGSLGSGVSRTKSVINPHLGYIKLIKVEEITINMTPGQFDEMFFIVPGGGSASFEHNGQNGVLYVEYYTVSGGQLSELPSGVSSITWDQSTITIGATNYSFIETSVNIVVFVFEHNFREQEKYR